MAKKSDVASSTPGLEADQVADILIQMQRIVAEQRDSIRSEIESVKQGVEQDKVERAERLGTLAKEVEALRVTTNSAWWLDKRFWSGFAAIPGLLLSGWLVKVAFADNAVLRLIHKGLGTEPALTEALKGTSDFRTEVEKSLKNNIRPASASLADAIKEMLAVEFIEKKAAEKFVQAEVGRHVRHADLLRVGLLYPERIETTACQISEQRLCYNFGKARLDVANSIFSIARGYPIEVHIGLNVISVGDSSDPISGRIEDMTARIDPLASLDVLVDGEPVKLIFQNAMYSRHVSGNRFLFRHYKIQGDPLAVATTQKEFPLHAVSIRRKEAATENIVITGMILVATPGGS